MSSIAGIPIVTIHTLLTIPAFCHVLASVTLTTHIQTGAVSIALAFWTVHKKPLTGRASPQIRQLVIGLIDRSRGSALQTLPNAGVAWVITPPTEGVPLTVLTGVEVRAACGWTFGFVCGPLHTLAVNEGGDVGVGFHTLLLVTAPHTAGGRTVLTVRLHVARHRAGRLVRVIKVIESIVGAFAALLTHVLLPPQTLGEGVTPLTLVLLTARLIPLISTLREIVVRLWEHLLGVAAVLGRRTIAGTPHTSKGCRQAGGTGLEFITNFILIFSWITLLLLRLRVAGVKVRQGCTPIAAPHTRPSLSRTPAVSLACVIGAVSW